MATLRKEGISLPANDALVISECVFRVKDPMKESATWGRLLAQEVCAANEIFLSDVVLKFICATNIIKERLSDVIIQRLGK